MFEKGEWIVYGNTGVCRVEDIGIPHDIPVKDSEKSYYKLNPAYEAGEIYIPVDTKVFMRPVLTKEEAGQLLSNMSVSSEKMNPEALEEEYRQCLSDHECREWMHLLTSIRHKEWEMSKQGKKIGKLYLRYEKRAQELLYGELSIALDIPYEEMEEYMKQRFTELFSTQTKETQKSSIG